MVGKSPIYARASRKDGFQQVSSEENCPLGAYPQNRKGIWKVLRSSLPSSRRLLLPTVNFSCSASPGSKKFSPVNPGVRRKSEMTCVLHHKNLKPVLLIVVKISVKIIHRLIQTMIQIAIDGTTHQAQPRCREVYSRRNTGLTCKRWSSPAMPRNWPPASTTRS